MRRDASSRSDLSAATAAFRNYIGLKLHFNDHIVWNRNQHSKIGQEALLKRKDAFLFMRLVDNFPKQDDQIERMVTLFKNNPSAWIGDLFTEETKELHRRRMAIVNSLSYSFTNDIDKIVDLMLQCSMSVKDLLKSKDNKVPGLIYMEPDIIGGIKDETLALLDKATGYCRQETNDPLWNQRSFILGKYKYWLHLKEGKLEEGISKLVECGKRL